MCIRDSSLAGLRVGFAVGDAALIEGLERVKNSFISYPLDRLAIHGAVAAIEDQAYFEQCCETIIATRSKLTEQLTELGFEVLPSATNFVFAKHTHNNAEEITAKLRERAIIVRHFKQARIKDFLRITIGTEDECKALIDALQEILN